MGIAAGAGGVVVSPGMCNASAATYPAKDTGSLSGRRRATARSGDVRCGSLARLGFATVTGRALGMRSPCGGTPAIRTKFGVQSEQPRGDGIPWAPALLTIASHLRYERPGDAEMSGYCGLSHPGSQDGQ